VIGDGTQVIDESGRRHGWRRPVAVPDDIDDAPKASGTVELPLHVYWSGKPRQWDLDNARQRARLYEVVLAEGTEDDVRWFIDVDVLIGLWPGLYLPQHVRVAWCDFVRRTRGIDLGC
jgi:hypothetical protein